MNIHIHIHHHYPSESQIMKQLSLLTNKIDNIMSTQAEAAAALEQVSGKLDTALSQLDKVSTETAALQTEIQELKDAAANTGNVDPALQAAIDKVAARADSIAQKVSAIDDQVPDATTQEPTPDQPAA